MFPNQNNQNLKNSFHNYRLYSVFCLVILSFNMQHTIIASINAESYK